MTRFRTDVVEAYEPNHMPSETTSNNDKNENKISALRF